MGSTWFDPQDHAISSLKKNQVINGLTLDLSSMEHPLSWLGFMFQNKTTGLGSSGWAKDASGEEQKCRTAGTLRSKDSMEVPPPNRISKQSLLVCGNLTWFNSLNICVWFRFWGQRKFLHHRLHRPRSRGTLKENVMGEGCGAAYFLILRWPRSSWDSPLGLCLNRFKHA